MTGAGSAATVGIAQWAPRPGESAHNEAVAARAVGELAARGCTAVVLPELWICGYRPATLARDAAAAAQPVGGPLTGRLSQLAARHRVLLCAGTVVESDPRDAGRLYNTALVFGADGALLLAQRKTHLYPPGGEHLVFTAGDRFATAETAQLGRVACAICYDGDFPETARTLAAAGAGVVLAPAAYEAAAESWWDTLYPAHALTGGQWWISANQSGAGGSGMLGGSRIIAPDGRTVAAASRHGAAPSGNRADDAAEPELLVARIDVAGERGRVADDVALLSAPRRLPCGPYAADSRAGEGSRRPAVPPE